MSHAPRFADARDSALVTDDDLLNRVSSLLERAVRRQVWLMFLDDRSRQLPVLMPSYVPRKPAANDARRLAEFFHDVSEEVDASSIVVTFERPGGPTLTDADLHWLRVLRDACLLSDTSFRGPMLCHKSGVRWVPPDEYLGG